MTENTSRALSATSAYSRKFVVGTVFLAFLAAAAIEQNPTYRAAVDGFINMFDASKAQTKPRRTPVVATTLGQESTAEEVDARIIQGFVEIQAEEDARARALAANPIHPMSGRQAEVESLRARVPRSVTVGFNEGTGRFEGTIRIRRPVREVVALTSETAERAN